MPEKLKLIEGELLNLTKDFKHETAIFFTLKITLFVYKYGNLPLNFAC